MPQSYDKTTIKVNTRGKTKREFAKDIATAICEVQMLVYENRTVDLDEPQTYSMLLLSDLLGQMIQRGGSR